MAKRKSATVLMSDRQLCWTRLGKEGLSEEGGVGNSVRVMFSQLSIIALGYFKLIFIRVY